MFTCEYLEELRSDGFFFEVNMSLVTLMCTLFRLGKKSYTLVRIRDLIEKYLLYLNTALFIEYLENFYMLMKLLVIH